MMQPHGDSARDMWQSHDGIFVGGFVPLEGFALCEALAHVEQ